MSWKVKKQRRGSQGQDPSPDQGRGQEVKVGVGAGRDPGQETEASMDMYHAVLQGARTGSARGQGQGRNLPLDQDQGLGQSQNLEKEANHASGLEVGVYQRIEWIPVLIRSTGFSVCVYQKSPFLWCVIVNF